MSLKRVYHPTGNAWQDVPESAAKDWKDAGWRLTKPDHVDDSAALPPGEGYVAPELVDISGTAAHALVDVPEAAVEPAKADEK